MITPAEAAYLAFLATSNKGKHGPNVRTFEQLRDFEKRRWAVIADAVIEQSKTIIAEEMAKALMRSDDLEKMNALMWYAGKRSSEQRLKDDGKRAAKALRAVITQQPASVHQS